MYKKRMAVFFFLTVLHVNAGENVFEFIRDIAATELKKKFPEIDFQGLEKKIRYIGKLYIKPKESFLNQTFSITPIILLELPKEGLVLCVRKPMQNDRSREEKNTAYQI